MMPQSTAPPPDRRASLLVFSSVLHNDPVLMEDVTEVVSRPSERFVHQRPRGSIRWQGGPFLYTFRIEAETDDETAVSSLIDRFHNWLGGHFVEYGQERQEWLIAELKLTLGGLRRVRSLRYMFNAVRSWYTELSVIAADNMINNPGFEIPAETGNLVDNPGFEALDPRPTQHFAQWSQATFGGSIDIETTNTHSGSQAARLTGGTTVSPQSRINQNIRVQANQRYHLSFFTRGDGTAQGQWELVDNTNYIFIQSLTDTGVPGTTYQEITLTFTAPAETRSLQLRFYSPSGDGEETYFDTVTLTHEKQFDGWAEIPGDGRILTETSAPHEGDQAAIVESGPGFDTYIAQTQNVEPEQQWQLAFWTHGDGSNAGRYQIIDVTQGADIVALTGTAVTGTTFTQITEDFTIPAGCDRIEIRLYGPAVDTATTTYDDVSLRRYQPQAFLSDFTTNDESIQQYGRREIQLGVDNIEQTQAMAIAHRDQFLAEHAWPWPRPDDIITSIPLVPTLEVVCIGYFWTAYWLYRTIPSEVTITDALTSLVNALPYLEVGEIANNNREVLQGTWGRAGRLIWDVLVPQGDDQQNHYRAHIRPGRQFVYEPADLLRPIGYITDLSGRPRRRAGGPHMTAIEERPGILRDLTWPINTAEPGSILNSEQDMLVDEVLRGPEDDTARRTTAVISDAALLAAQGRYAWIADEDII